MKNYGVTAGGLLVEMMILLGGGHAQTMVDLRTQSKSIDFSGVPTKTTQTGTVLPATCSTGQIFYKTDAPGGENMLYGCTGTNTWTIMSGASAGIPYNGATQDVDLGAYNLKSMAVSTGTPGQPTHLDMTKGLCPSTASTGYDVTLCVDADGKTKIVRSDGTVEQMSGLTDPAVNGVVFRSAPDTTRPATGNDLPGFSAAGPNHSGGAVPDPGANVGTTKFLREDATWAQPPSGVGQALSSGIWRPVFPEAAAANASYASSGGQNKSVVLYRVSNAFASLTVATLLTINYSGIDKAVMGVFDKNCNLIQESSTVSMTGPGGVTKFTLAPPAVVTDPQYFIAFSTEGTSSFSLMQNGIVSLIVSINDNLPAAAALANTAANPAIQGGPGATMHMPASCGALAPITGVSGLPPMWFMSTN